MGPVPTTYIVAHNGHNPSSKESYALTVYLVPLNVGKQTYTYTDKSFLKRRETMMSPDGVHLGFL